VVQGIEEQDKEVPQQCEREDIEELRRVGNCNCNYAQRHQGRRRGGNTNLTVPASKMIYIYSAPNIDNI
jgi:hypothetical protein